MFLQIKIREQDQPAQMFLWRETNRDQQPNTYVMTSMLFGAALSPYTAQYVMRKNAATFEPLYPKAVNSINRKHYVDDYLDSFDSIEEAIDIVKAVVHIHKKGGFEIRNWSSNETKLLKELPNSAQNTENIDLTVGQAPVEKTLGLKWNPIIDTISFDLNFKKIPTDLIQGQRIPSKREVLSIVMSMFDPLGLLIPYTIRNKISLQEIWRSGITWDENLKTRDFILWKEWISDLGKIKSYQIPRAYCGSAIVPDDLELHIFCDASDKAYSAVAYLRSQDKENKIQIPFIAGKARVAPLKPVSTPRMELQGALLATRLEDTISKELELKLNRLFFWTDSRTVLGWILSDSRNKWLCLIRSTALLLSAVRICKDEESKTLTAEYLDKAEEDVLIKVQLEDFRDEIQSIMEKKPTPKGSRIKGLTYLIAVDGILKVDSRIKASKNTPDTVKAPIILDGKHHLTRLLVQYYHERFHHGSTETVVNELRQKYWIIKIRPTVKSVVSCCKFCRLKYAIAEQPRTGDMPEARLGHHQRSFTYCGVDYFGPMQVTIGRRREKHWEVLFTCLTTRAVHLELASSLSTDSAIMALQRMSNRRGTPSEIHSDNGTNFTGTNKELKNAIKDIDLEKYKNHLTNLRITWRFIPPSAPHMGGSWERLVRSVKRALSTTLNEKAPKEEVLKTLLTEVKHTVNSRPLTHVSVDHRDQESLTPNHFLIGNGVNSVQKI
ncbi:uncharacterized protein LOC122498926 [Leptopilina heterotoma]|uniref:uncharacterized protein LOC122498926 n=1 Tax=Leptopilina heterotoma TaxID=63436 RepID=UPI001CAA17B4|nr:uncharacterized protein LOC122498926 [Leptopilina heterotoma]